jgi:hypothetical protein
MPLQGVSVAEHRKREFGFPVLRAKVTHLYYQFLSFLFLFKFIDSGLAKSTPWPQPLDLEPMKVVPVSWVRSFQG